MDWLRPAAQHMAAQVSECRCQLVAAFCKECFDEGGRDEYLGIERSTECFDSAGNVHGVADDRELQPAVAANIALGDLPIVNADGNADRWFPRSKALFTPLVD